MKIGIDISALAQGRGPGRYLSEILEAWRRTSGGGEFMLYSPTAVEINLGDRYVLRHLPKQFLRPWLNWTLPRVALKDGIDVMLFPANDFWLWPWTPTVVVVHDIAQATLLAEYRRGLFDAMQVKAQMLRLKYVAKAVATVSHYSAEKISRHCRIPSGDIRVIHNGVSEKFTPPIGGGRENFILYVGGFDRRKNLERLLDAFVRLRTLGYRGRLVLAGRSVSSGYRQLYYDMPALVKAKGISEGVEVIENPGDERIIGLYRTAKLFVFPSLVEGFGLPVLEAMACGCPVVCSNAASLPEVGGDAVRYFDPYDVTAMADAMEEVLSNKSLRAQMVEKGLKRVKLFSWERAGQEVYRILKETAAKRS